MTTPKRTSAETAKRKRARSAARRPAEAEDGLTLEDLMKLDPKVIDPGPLRSSGVPAPMRRPQRDV